MADIPLQTESAQANLPSAHQLAQDAQAEFWDIQNRAEELGELLAVMEKSSECGDGIKQALRAVGTLVGLIEVQAGKCQREFEAHMVALPRGQNVARLARP